MPAIETATGYYPARFALRMPMEMQAAVNEAARLSLTSPSEYLRRAVLASLRADGVTLAAGRRSAQVEVSAP